MEEITYTLKLSKSWKQLDLNIWACVDRSLHALKQVTTLDKLELGYLPRQISVHLSVFLDKELGNLTVRFLWIYTDVLIWEYCLSLFMSVTRFRTVHLLREVPQVVPYLFVYIQGFVLTVPEDVYEAVPIKVILEKKNLEPVYEEIIRKCWQGALAASLVPPKQFKYEANFLCLLQTVLERDSHLLNSDEQTFLSKLFPFPRRLITFYSSVWYNRVCISFFRREASVTCGLWAMSLITESVRRLFCLMIESTDWGTWMAAGSFQVLSGDAQRLFIHLYQRKGAQLRHSS